MHNQTLVKVNVPVDEEVAPLVLALNRFPQVLTLESCQEGQDGRAFVVFTFLNAKAGDGVGFLTNLSKQIGDRRGDLRVLISLEWFAGGENSLAWLRIPTDQTKDLAAVLEAIADSWRN